jgi:hypothetical protein
MTKGRRHTSGEAEEQEPAISAVTGETAQERQQTGINRWYRRVSFWRAVAGMAIAIALGSLAVALEIASELSSRSTFFHHRMESIRSRIASLRAEQSASANISRVLSASDVVLLRLIPTAGSKAHGLIALSREAGGAFIEVGGLSIPAGHKCELWWLSVRGDAIRAIESDPEPDGHLSLAVPMPPGGTKIAGAIITLEPGKVATLPKGKVLLRGALLSPRSS